MTDKLKPGDVCLECARADLGHKLRHFFIDVNEQLLKCESRQCLWPHNDEVSSSDSDDDDKTLLGNTQSKRHEDEALQQLVNIALPDIVKADENESPKPSSSICNAAVFPALLDEIGTDFVSDRVAKPHPVEYTWTAPAEATQLALPNSMPVLELMQPQPQLPAHARTACLKMKHKTRIKSNVTFDKAPLPAATYSTHSTLPVQSATKKNFVFKLPNPVADTNADSIPKASLSFSSSTQGNLSMQAPPRERATPVTPQASSAGKSLNSAARDRVVTRSATMLAVFGIALSSFSLKQLLANKQAAANQRSLMRKF